MDISRSRKELKAQETSRGDTLSIFVLLTGHENGYPTSRDDYDCSQYSRVPENGNFKMNTERYMLLCLYMIFFKIENSIQISY